MTDTTINKGVTYVVLTSAPIYDSNFAQVGYFDPGANLQFNDVVWGYTNGRNGKAYGLIHMMTSGKAYNSSGQSLSGTSMALLSYRVRLSAVYELSSNGGLIIGNAYPSVTGVVTYTPPLTYKVRPSYNVTMYTGPSAKYSSNPDWQLNAGDTASVYATWVDDAGVTWAATDSTMYKWCMLYYSGGALYPAFEDPGDYTSAIVTSRTSTTAAQFGTDYNAATTGSWGNIVRASELTYADMDAISTTIDNLAVTAGSANEETTLISLSKMKQCIGIPPKLSSVADPRYMTDANPPNDFGRAYTEMFMMNSTIFSIQPCKVTYLPGYSDAERDTFFTQMTEYVTNAMDDAELKEGKGLNGQLFEATPDYNTYINTVNMLARTMAILLGIGEKKFMGTGPTYTKMDYSFYKLQSKASIEGQGIFGAVVDATRSMFDSIVTSAINDDTYVHFFTTSDGTSTSDSMSVSTRASSMESLFSSQLSGVAADLQFLFSGTNFMESMGNLTDAVTNTIGGALPDSMGTVLQSLIESGGDYLDGGRLVFPQMLDDCSYDRSYTASCRFISPYGDVESIFLHCFLPLCYIWPYVIPQMISDNMYRYPFLARADAHGLFHADLAAITNMRIQRGGNDGTSWTADGLPFEISVQFDVTPLYSKLMTANARHPILFLGNSSLHEYLGAMCGVSFTGDQIQLKMAIVKSLMSNEITDTIPSILRGYYSSGMANALRKVFAF